MHCNHIWQQCNNDHGYEYHHHCCDVIVEALALDMLSGNNGNIPITEKIGSFSFLHSDYDVTLAYEEYHNTHLEYYTHDQLCHRSVIVDKYSTCDREYPDENYGDNRSFYCDY